MTWHIVVSGIPRTKKTSNQAVIQPSKSGKGQPCPHCQRKLLASVFPSANWRKWVKEAEITINGNRLTCVQAGDRTALVLQPPGGRPAVRWEPIAVDVNCAARFYRDKNVGDMVGFFQGLADLLEKRGVVVNDRHLVQPDGTRLLKDAVNPRVEVTLTPVTDGQMAFGV